MAFSLVLRFSHAAVQSPLNTQQLQPRSLLAHSRHSSLKSLWCTSTSQGEEPRPVLWSRVLTWSRHLPTTYLSGLVFYSFPILLYDSTHPGPLVLPLNTSDVIWLQGLCTNFLLGLGCSSPRCPCGLHPHILQDHSKFIFALTYSLHLNYQPSSLTMFFIPLSCFASSLVFTTLYLLFHI